MKTVRIIPVFLIAFLLFIGASCQKEEKVFIDETNDEETITLNSVLTGMLVSASQNNGYIDNIIDGSSCISVALPVTVIANNQEVLIASENDYALIIAIFEEFVNDIDTLEFVFPITVVFEQFNEIQVESQSQLDGIITACQNIIADTYTCVDFVYPIQCFTYNETSEETGLVTLDDDQQWFDYLNYLQEGIYIAIDYPMGVVIDNVTTVVNNNQELYEIMSQANCDLSGGIVDPVTFENKLTNGTWYINLYDEDGTDGTCDYAAYKFQFNMDGTVIASSDMETRNGLWTLENEGEELDLLLEFELVGTDDPFEALTAVWQVLESSVQTVKLKDNNGGDGTFDHLYFGRDPATNCGSGNAQVLIDILLDGTWFVETYLDDGIDETGNYSAFDFTFLGGGTVVATEGIYTYYGTWGVIGTSELQVGLDFGMQIPLTNFNSDWDVLIFNVNRVELEDMSGGGTDTLIFEKL